MTKLNRIDINQKRYQLQIRHLKYWNWNNNQKKSKGL